MQESRSTSHLGFPTALSSLCGSKWDNECAFNLHVRWKRILVWLHHTCIRHEHGLAASALLVFDYLCFDARGFINQPSAPRGTSAAGEPGAKIARCSLSHTGFCLNISQAANPPVKADSVGEHICKTKQGCGRPGSLWLARWIIHSRPCRVTDAHSGGEALFITKLGSAVFRYPPSPFRCPFRF